MPSCFCQPTIFKRRCLFRQKSDIKTILNEGLSDQYKFAHGKSGQKGLKITTFITIITLIKVKSESLIHSVQARFVFYFFNCLLPSFDFEFYNFIGLLIMSQNVLFVTLSQLIFCHILIDIDDSSCDSYYGPINTRHFCTHYCDKKIF